MSDQSDWEPQFYEPPEDRERKRLRSSIANLWGIICQHEQRLARLEHPRDEKAKDELTT